MTPNFLLYYSQHKYPNRDRNVSIMGNLNVSKIVRYIALDQSAKHVDMSFPRHVIYRKVYIYIYI